MPGAGGAEPPGLDVIFVKAYPADTNLFPVRIKVIPGGEFPYSPLTGPFKGFGQRLLLFLFFSLQDCGVQLGTTLGKGIVRKDAFVREKIEHVFVTDMEAEASQSGPVILEGFQILFIVLITRCMFMVFDPSAQAFDAVMQFSAFGILLNKCFRDSISQIGFGGGIRVEEVSQRFKEFRLQVAKQFLEPLRQFICMSGNIIQPIEREFTIILVGQRTENDSQIIWNGRIV